MSDFLLVTGGNGEVGHELIPQLKKLGKFKLITLNLDGPDPALVPYTDLAIKGNVLDKKLLKNLFSKYKILGIFHLAAILSTSGEKDPEKAHQVNVEGTANLLEVATMAKRPLKFIFPSTIAVYGIPDLQTKRKAKKVHEEEFNTPITMYGLNKLYCEMLGRYYSSYYRLLEDGPRFIDFRSVRFPGLISATTLPSGGTSDFASEMIHAAAQGKPYESFVRADTRIPFMAMPDAGIALIKLFLAPKEKLRRHVYNVRGFSPKASDFEMEIKIVYPKAKITYKPTTARQKIVDSWPEDLNDSAARRDWGWKAKFDFKKAFSEYLLPTISKRYK